MSIRPDLLPATFLYELQKLCDAVPSFPSDEAMALEEEQLVRPVGQIYENIDQSVPPVAAASLGQVYRARLREEGVEVAVKVQRPDMLESVMQDLYIVRQLATALDRVKSVVTSQRPYNVALLDKFATANIKELDYVNEARNQNFFKTGLEPRLGGRVYVPKVYDRYTTRKVRGSQTSHLQYCN